MTTVTFWDIYRHANKLQLDRDSDPLRGFTDDGLEDAAERRATDRFSGSQGARTFCRYLQILEAAHGDKLAVFKDFP